MASFAWRMLLTLMICRSVFVLHQWQAVKGAGTLGAIYAEGLRFDLALLMLVLIVPVMGFPILTSNKALVNAWRGLFTVCLPVVVLVIVLVECATPSFVDQLDTRPALIFLEYLNDPAGVARALWATFRTPIVVTAALALVVTWINVQRLSVIAGRVRPVGVVAAAAVMPVLLTASFLAFGFIADNVVAKHAPAPVAVAAYNASGPGMVDQGQ